MGSSKQLLAGLMVIGFTFGAMGLVTPQESRATGGNFPQKHIEKNKCGVFNFGQRFVTSNDGTEVCDNRTGYIWEQDPDSSIRGSMTQAEAIAFCPGLDKGNGQTYHAPSMQTLVSVLDLSQNGPALTPDVFDGIVSDRYWTATPFAGGGTIAGYAVQMIGGFVPGGQEDDEYFVWCVRDSQVSHGY